MQNRPVVDLEKANVTIRIIGFREVFLSNAAAAESYFLSSRFNFHDDLKKFWTWE